MLGTAKSIKTRLTITFSFVIFVSVCLFSILGTVMIGNTIVRQAQDKVRLDLNTAHEIYLAESENIKNIIRLSSQRLSIINNLKTKNRDNLYTVLKGIKEDESFDICTVTDEKGYVVVRALNYDNYGDQPKDDVLHWVLNNKKPVVATSIVSEAELRKESGELAELARIKLLPTPKARFKKEVVETSGMMIKAAAPIYDNNSFIGILYGGKLLNHDYKIVDKVKDIVYRGEVYKGVEIGTTTIFLDDVRISTNVKGKDGKRAIGTRVSEEVYNYVYHKGETWIGRAFVVNAWYLTAYEPIKDINNKIVGMLYAGILERPYTDLRDKVIIIFWIIALITIILLLVISHGTTKSIVKPISELVKGTKCVAGGDLSYKVELKSEDEIGELASAFNRMTDELNKITQNYLNLTKTLEDKVKEKTEELHAAQEKLIQSEKLTALGKLSAAIAHEVNNPLTSILLNGYLLAEKIGSKEKCKDNLNLIIEETMRCSNIIKGLLEFARQSIPEKRVTDINDLIEKTLPLFQSQAILNKVNFIKQLDKNVPMILVDPDKMKQVIINVILNAIEAMPQGGDLTIITSADNSEVKVIIGDTGVGILQDCLNKIFDPFFTTKGAKGTGLGLSVSYGIIQQHNGTIDIESEVGKGTTVIIKLPIGAMNF